MVRTKRPVHVPDITKEKAYLRGDSTFTAAVRLGGYRTLLSVPMLQNGKLIGTLAIERQEVRPFTEKQIDLVTNFGAQAVIAIENTRLLNELRQRTDDLTESLEQQTATSEVLRVISSSPGQLEPVFQAMLENAARICRASFGFMFRTENRCDDSPTSACLKNFWMLWKVTPDHPGPLTASGRLIKARQTIHIADYSADKDGPIP